MDRRVFDMQPIKDAITKAVSNNPDTPDLDDYDAAFLEALRDRLNPRLKPVGFVLAARLLAEDIRAGRSGFPGKPLPSKLVGLGPLASTLAFLYSERTVEFATTYGGSKFGEAVFEAVTEIRGRMSAGAP